MLAESLELAKAWAEARANRPVVEVDAQPLPMEGAGESPYDVRDRLRKAEKAIAGEMRGLDEALKRARKDGDVSLAYKLSRSLRSAREEHRKAIDSLLKAEKRIVELEKARGALVTLDVAKDLITRTLAPVTAWLKRLANSARNDDEKALLTQSGEDGLALIRDSASAVARYTVAEGAK